MYRRQVLIMMAAASLALTSLLRGHVPARQSAESCSILLPSVGDVIDGVKCAVTDYLIDRAAKLEGEAKHRLIRSW